MVRPRAEPDPRRLRSPISNRLACLWERRLAAIQIIARWFTGVGDWPRTEVGAIRLDDGIDAGINPRTLEICERLGVSADDIRASGASIADGGAVHFVDVLSGACFGSLPYERQDEGAREFTPWPLVKASATLFFS